MVCKVLSILIEEGVESQEVNNLAFTVNGLRIQNIAQRQITF